jgi:DNA polymerase III subunit delta
MTTTFYLFHGSDEISIDAAVARLRAEMGDGPDADMNTTEFDGAEATVPEILAAVSSYPFLADRRLVIVRGLLGWLTRKGAGQTGKQALARLEEDVPSLPDYARLVLVERGEIPAKNAIVKLAQTVESGYMRVFNAPKDTTGWISQRARETYAVEIDGRAAAALAAVTGDDLRRADNELVKLVSYVDGQRSITEDDVVALTPYVAEASIFKMVDAIAEGRGQVALQLMHRLMAEKDQDALKLYGMIIRQFRLLITAKEHLMAGGDAGSIPGMSSFVARTVARQSREFSIEQLEKIYRNLAETDFKIKTGRIQAELALDLFVASVAH